jgi:hypothetical protein
LKKIILPAAFLLLFSGHAYTQELVSNEYEKGYIKDGQKYMVWEYYDENQELQLTINHTTGKIYFLKEDTTDFVIFRDGLWVEEKLRVYPIPLEGYTLFYRAIKRNLRYPYEARRLSIDGQIVVMFEVDEKGMPSNYSIVKDIGGGCGQEVIRVLNQIQTPWVPAQANNQTYKAKFLLPITLGLGKRPKIKKLREAPPLAKWLSDVEIIAMGVVSPR